MRDGIATKFEDLRNHRFWSRRHQATHSFLLSVLSFRGISRLVSLVRPSAFTRCAGCALLRSLFERF